MKKYVCLRDDDTNYFTTPEELKFDYGEFWGEIPITLATIPFSHGSDRKILDYNSVPDKFHLLRDWEIDATADELSSYHKVYPIGDNINLVATLKELIGRGKIEIAQHGVFHKYNENGPEMIFSKTSYFGVRDGKEYLEKVFNTRIHTFIPPSNTIDPICLSYIKQLKMHLFCSGSIYYENAVSRLKSYISDPVSIIDKLTEMREKRNNPVRRRLGQYMFGSITYDAFKSQSDIFDLLKKSLNEFGFVALGTHYRTLSRDSKYRCSYLDLLRKLSSLDSVEFVTANDYYKLLIEEFYE